MHSLNNLADHFGLTYNQTRDRVIALQGKFESEFRGGNGAQYRITDNGFKIFERLRTLEQSGYNMKSAINELEEERSDLNREEKSEGLKSPNSSERYIKSLESQVKELRKDKARLQEKVDTLEQRLITGEVEEDEKDEFKEMSLVQLVKRWLTTKT